jgi:hypothetical protein
MSATFVLRLGCCVLLGCAGTAESVDDKTTPVVVITPDDLEDALTVRLPSKGSINVESPDGKLTLRVWSGSFTRDTQVTIARLREGSTPKGVVGSAYLLSPEFTTSLKPMRLTIAHGSLPSGTHAENLRLARLDTGGAYYRPVGGQAILAAQRLGAATPSSFGVYGVIDVSLVDIEDDVASTAYWRGEHLFDLGLVEEAALELENAYNASPSRVNAFAHAFTRMLSLPALPALTDFFTDCGQAPWSGDVLFGPGGWVAQSTARAELGTSALRLGVGFDSDNIVTRDLSVGSLVVEPLEQPICAMAPSGDNVALPLESLRVSISDPNYDGRGNSLRLTLQFDATQPATSGTAAGSTFTFDAVDLRGQLFAELGEEIDGDKPSTDLRSRDQPGDFSVAAANAGTIQISVPSVSEGATVSVVFDQVVLEPPVEMDPPQVLVLSGTFSAPVSVTPPQPSMALLQEDVSLTSVLLDCASTVDEARLLDLAEALGSEAAALSGLYGEAAASGAEDFSYDVSLGFLHQPGAISVGAVEAEVLTSAFEILSAVSAALQTYHLFVGDLRNALVTESVEILAPCDDPCANQDVCVRSGTPTTEDQLAFAAPLLAAALNPVFLTRDTGAGDLTTVRDRLDSALSRVLVAMARPTGSTGIFAFQNEASEDGTSVIMTFVDEALRGLYADDVSDAVLQSGFEFFLVLDGVFTDPPTVDSLRASLDPVPTDPAFSIIAEGPWDCGGSRPTTCTAICNGSPAALVDCGFGCATPPTVAELCATVPGNERTFEMSDWLFEALDALYIPSADTISCDSVADCPVLAGVACEGSCSYELTDVAPLQAWGEGNTPYLNQRFLASFGELELPDVFGGSAESSEPGSGN